jgi:hypothetical protein
MKIKTESKPPRGFEGALIPDKTTSSYNDQSRIIASISPFILCSFGSIIIPVFASRRGYLLKASLFYFIIYM